MVSSMTMVGLQGIVGGYYCTWCIGFANRMGWNWGLCGAERWREKQWSVISGEGEPSFPKKFGFDGLVVERTQVFKKNSGSGGREQDLYRRTNGITI